MLHFEPLASSSDGCAYRLSGGGASAPLLIDCGLTGPQLQKALNFESSKLCGCLVSHAHMDHARAVPWLASRGIPCYASLEAIRDLYQRIPALHLHRVMSINVEVPAMIGEWCVVPFEVVHDAPGTLGFVITAPSAERLLYLTDSCYSRHTFPGLTHIAVECNHSAEIMRDNVMAGKIDRTRFSRTSHTHMSLERLLEMLAANDLSKVVEIHLLHLSDENSNEAEFKKAVEAATGIPVKVAAK